MFDDDFRHSKKSRLESAFDKINDILRMIVTKKQNQDLKKKQKNSSDVTKLKRDIMFEMVRLNNDILLNKET